MRDKIEKIIWTKLNGISLLKYLERKLEYYKFRNPYIWEDIYNFINEVPLNSVNTFSEDLLEHLLNFIKILEEDTQSTSTDLENKNK